jgi:hypothetical protein
LRKTDLTAPGLQVLDLEEHVPAARVLDHEGVCHAAGPDAAQ